MSDFFEPQLARDLKIEKFGKKDFRGWYMEPKHDGMRAVVHVGLDSVEIYSRSGKVYAQLLPELATMFSYLPAGTVIDGELAVVDDYQDLMYWTNPVQGPGAQGIYSMVAKVPVVNFNKTMRIMGTGVEKALKRQDPVSGDDKDNPFVGKMSFIAFDLPFTRGLDLRETVQGLRSVLLHELVREVNDPRLIINPVLPVDLAIYEELVAAGGEGVILKNREGIYKSGRNSDWLKIKSVKTFDVVVMGFTEANEGKTGKFKGQIGAIEFGAYQPDGTLQYVGRCSGMNDAERLAWTERSNAWEQDDDAEKWVIEVKANELVGSGEYKTPRHPNYVGIRIDKEPKDCLMEQFK